MPKLLGIGLAVGSAVVPEARNAPQLVPARLFSICCRGTATGAHQTFVLHIAIVLG